MPISKTFVSVGGLLALCALSLGSVGCGLRPLTEAEKSRLQNFAQVTQEFGSDMEVLKSGRRDLGLTSGDTGARREFLRSRANACSFSDRKHGSMSVAVVTGSGCPIVADGSISGQGDERSFKGTGEANIRVQSSEYAALAGLSAIRVKMEAETEVSSSLVRLKAKADASVDSAAEGSVQLTVENESKVEPSNPSGARIFAVVRMKFKDFEAEVRVLLEGGKKELTLNGQPISESELQKLMPAMGGQGGVTLPRSNEGERPAPRPTWSPTPQPTWSPTPSPTSSPDMSDNTPLPALRGMDPDIFSKLGTPRACWKVVYAFAGSELGYPYDSDKAGLADDLCKARVQHLANYVGTFINAVAYAKYGRELPYASNQVSFAREVASARWPRRFLRDYIEEYAYARDVRKVPYDSNRHSFAMDAAQEQQR